MPFLHIKKANVHISFAGRFLGSGDEKHVLLILIDEKQLEDLWICPGTGRTGLSV